MNDDYYKHPIRHPKNIDGAFYSIADDADDVKKCRSQCLDCDLPQLAAPTLVKSLYDEDGDTYFIKQPVTNEEITCAIGSAESCCVQAIRYGGRDYSILKRMSPELCDFGLGPDGKAYLKCGNT